LKAARLGDIRMLSELHREGYSLLSIDETGKTALHYGARSLPLSCSLFLTPLIPWHKFSSLFPILLYLHFSCLHIFICLIIFLITQHLSFLYLSFFFFILVRFLFLSFDTHCFCFFFSLALCFYFLFQSLLFGLYPDVVERPLILLAQ
jgi:hypothetical protein